MVLGGIRKETTAINKAKWRSAVMQNTGTAALSAIANAFDAARWLIVTREWTFHLVGDRNIRLAREGACDASISRMISTGSRTR